MSFMSFTLYRAAHQTHHMHLGSQRDEELWPFTNPRISRGWRMLAAFVELNCGIFFTPFLFFRSFLRPGSPIRSPKVRRRIWAEVILMVVVWTLIIGGVAWFGAWRYFLWVYAMPAYIAGNLQSWRKYIEHVGLTGATERSATRSIIPGSVAGRVFSFTLLHEPFHGVHHLHSGLTHAELPSRAESLYPTHPDEHEPFPNYRGALRHLLRSLLDPRVGAQWRVERQESAAA
jgi:fatty acid desaturase